MKKLKQILFGTVGMFPLWVGYLLVGLLINSTSTSGINGYMGEWQADHPLNKWLGFLIALLGVPGFLVWLYSITAGQLIKKK